MNIRGLFFVVLSGAVLQGQALQVKPGEKLKHLHSDKIEVKLSKYEGNPLFTGNVIFEHNGAKLYSDSAVFYQKKNQFKAFSNVRLISGDTLSLTSDYLDYDGNTQKGLARGRVVLKNRMQQLRSDKIIYDRVANKAYYDNGGEITTATGNIIKSKVGIYDIAASKNEFKTDVYIESDEYIMESENAKHYNHRDLVEFYGPTVIRSKNNPSDKIISQNGKYYLKSRESFLNSRSTIYYNQKVLTGNRIYFNQKTGFGKATGDVIIHDPAEKRKLYGDYGEIFQYQDSALIRGNALFEKQMKNDVLYFRSREMVAIEKGGKKIVRAYNKAKLYKKDVQGIADSIVYNETQDIIHFYKNPIIWSGVHQLTGDTIRVYTNTFRETIDSLHVRGHAFAISKTTEETTSRFNQIKGTRMFAKVKDNNLDFLYVEGNASSVNFIDEEEKEKDSNTAAITRHVIGINHSTCGKIRVNFIGRELQIVKCQIGAKSKVYPEKDLPEKVRYLPDFKWREDERPRGLFDLK